MCNFKVIARQKPVSNYFASGHASLEHSDEAESAQSQERLRHLVLAQEARMTAGAYAGKNQSALIEQAEEFEKLAREHVIMASPTPRAEVLARMLAYLHSAWKSRQPDRGWPSLRLRLIAQFHKLRNQTSLRPSWALPLAVMAALSGILWFVSDRKSSAGESSKAEATNETATTARSLQTLLGPPTLILTLIVPIPSDELKFADSNSGTGAAEPIARVRPVAAIARPPRAKMATRTAPLTGSKETKGLPARRKDNARVGFEPGALKDAKSNASGTAPRRLASAR
jgi:hypothetical protein